MRSRLIRMGATGVVAVAFVATLATPASASTASATDTGGTEDIYDSSFTLQSSQSLVGGPTTCTASSGSVTATDTAPAGDGNGSLTMTTRKDTVRELFSGDHYRVIEVVNLTSGTYTSSGGTISLMGSSVANIRSVASSGSCTPTGSVNCNLTKSNLTLVGTTSPNTLPAATGKVFTLNGGNTVGDNIASGTCGALLALNNGYTDVIGWTVTT